MFQTAVLGNKIYTRPIILDSNILRIHKTFAQIIFLGTKVTRLTIFITANFPYAVIRVKLKIKCHTHHDNYALVYGRFAGFLCRSS
jgi:hypothetical protein